MRCSVCHTVESAAVATAVLSIAIGRWQQRMPAAVAAAQRSAVRIERIGSIPVVCFQVWVAKKKDDGRFYAIKKARQQFKGTGDR